MHDYTTGDEVVLEPPILGDDTQLIECDFVNAPALDYHLVGGTPCTDRPGAPVQDWDTSDPDLGMYGGPDGDWDYRPDSGDDDDDATPEDDDDATPEDDDDATPEDDDDATPEDDDDDDQPLPIPSGLRCNCDAARQPTSTWLFVLLGPLVLVRRRDRPVQSEHA